MIQPAQEPSTSREFVKQSSLYQEFLAEREEILRHKWIESERLGQDIGFERQDLAQPRGALHVVGARLAGIGMDQNCEARTVEQAGDDIAARQGLHALGEPGAGFGGGDRLASRHGHG